MTGARLRVGTRGSQLALRQTGLVLEAIRRVAPGIELETTIITTAGDRAVDVPLERLEGVGFFATELEAALVDGRCDLAVHSAKDLPTLLHPDLTLGAVPRRTEPRDVLISRGGERLAELPPGARVGTSSPRRAAQLRARRPDLRPMPIRGNLDTRLAKLVRGDCEALCVAGAGLVRMGWQDRITEWLAPSVMLPAPAQGALAVEIRGADVELRGLLAPLDDAATREAVAAERAFLGRLGSGCRAPAAALAEVGPAGLVLEALVAREDGTAVRRHRSGGPVGSAEWLGMAVADYLLAHAGGVLVELAGAHRTPTIGGPGAP